MEALSMMPVGVDSVLATDDLRVSFGDKEVLHGVSLGWARKTVSSIIGPSGCGKTTLLRSLNRLTELAPTARMGGRILLDGRDVMVEPPNEVRRRLGMVFQRPNPFPMSIFDNIAYALREQGVRRPGRRALSEPVEKALRRAAVWEEVKDELDKSALRLSGGQQQRLCIARVLAAQPDVMLMDEPCAALDPFSTAKIEELISDLRSELTLVVVTHNLAQARRISDRVAFLLDGTLIEEGNVQELFDESQSQETRDYVAGTYG